MFQIFFSLFLIVDVVVGRTALLHSIKDVAFYCAKISISMRWKTLYYVIKVGIVSLNWKAFMITF